MISGLSFARETYLQLNQKIKIEIYSNLAEWYFCYLDFNFTFTSLNLLYFEAFRKTIFLKKNSWLLFLRIT